MAVKPLKPGTLDHFFEMADKIDHASDNPLFTRHNFTFGGPEYRRGVPRPCVPCDPPSPWYRRWLRWPSRNTLLVLGLAQGWSQVKLWMTLLVAWTSWPAWVQWSVCTALAVVITVACFRSTEWAVRRWGPQMVVSEFQTGVMDLGPAK